MIKVYWTTTTTTDREISIDVDGLLEAIVKSGQTAPPRETDSEYIERVMDEIDIEEVLPFLEALPYVEINNDDVVRAFDTWEEVD